MGFLFLFWSASNSASFDRFGFSKYLHFCFCQKIMIQSGKSELVKEIHDELSKNTHWKSLALIINFLNEFGFSWWDLQTMIFWHKQKWSYFEKPNRSNDAEFEADQNKNRNPMLNLPDNVCVLKCCKYNGAILHQI